MNTERVIKSWILLVLIVSFFNAKAQGNKAFKSLNDSKEWHLKFNDEGTKNWKSKWFLDGLRANLVNTDKGLVFSAGEVEWDDACHAVLWTKETFKGDIKIEYDYTRTDARTKWVNILYIQATGVAPYSKDISKWNDKRTIPSMRTYFNNMEALHISYAAFGADNKGKENDYVKARRYPNLPGEEFQTATKIAPVYYRTGLFIPGETYKITVIKTRRQLFFYVKGKHAPKLFSWMLPKDKAVIEGRIGLRHMYTRSARYKNFKIYTKE